MTTCPYKGIQTRRTKYFGTGLDEVQKFEVSSVGFQKTITTTHCHFANFLPVFYEPALFTFMNCLKRKPGGFGLNGTIIPARIIRNMRQCGTSPPVLLNPELWSYF